jgi:hypothetical protein
VVVLSSGSGDVRWGDGERARNNDDVVELGDPKTIEGAGGELDTAIGKLDWGTVLGADIASVMGISALRTGDGSRAGSRRIAAIETSSQPILHCCTSTVHVQPFSTIKGICFSCKNFSISSAVRVSYARALLVYFEHKCQYFDLDIPRLR